MPSSLWLCVFVRLCVCLHCLCLFASLCRHTETDAPTRTRHVTYVGRFGRVARELYALTREAALPAGLPLRLVLISSFNGGNAGSATLMVASSTGT
jgi:hypothetical protein